MRQTWHDLLFAHWPVDAARLRTLVPPAFEIDAFDGAGWIGVVPFTMSDVAPRAVPAVPYLSAFPELNVRTYVSAQGKAGVYFFSLDAARWPVVLAARALFNLPYFTATMAVRTAGNVDYRSRRRSSPGVEFNARYAPAGPPHEPVAGTLEYFLTERYCLYGVDHRERPYRLEIDHPPWRLQAATAEISRNTTIPPAIPLPDVAPLLHFSKLQPMIGWWPEILR